MTKGIATQISLSIELEGKAYFVALPKERLQLLLKLAEGLSDDGKLPLIAAPPNYKFEALKP